MLRSPNAKCQSNPDISNFSGTVSSASQRKRKQPESEFGDAIATLSQELIKKLDDWRVELHGAISRVAENISNIQSDLATISQVTTEIKEELNSLCSNHTALAQKVYDQGLKIQGLTNDVTSLTKFQFSTPWINK
ncbi:hypothetical protein O3G_MSEX003910 [Manduca sexta]|uniref:Uncharacterized protein n=1 Tax=Manduca sexta TaxID=7130 RepID=A0A921YUQ9_MANSE|nr:hypothetical protein O3G_MSEX003910 [Manduca sexta]